MEKVNGYNAENIKELIPNFLKANMIKTPLK